MSTWDSGIDRVRYTEALHFRDWVEQIRSYLIWDPKALRSFAGENMPRSANRGRILLPSSVNSRTRTLTASRSSSGGFGI